MCSISDGTCPIGCPNAAKALGGRSIVADNGHPDAMRCQLSPAAAMRLAVLLALAAHASAQTHAGGDRRRQQVLTSGSCAHRFTKDECQYQVSGCLSDCGNDDWEGETSSMTSDSSVPRGCYKYTGTGWKVRRGRDGAPRPPPSFEECCFIGTKVQ